MPEPAGDEALIRRPKVWLCALAFLALNAWISARVFRIEFTPFMFSIEGAYMAVARWLKMNWAHSGWFPLWYGGIPFENAYPPVLTHLVALFSAATGMSVARSVHVVTATFYCLGPVALYGLTLHLTRSLWKACTAAWLYSVFSIAGVMLPWTRAGLTPWGPVRLLALLTHDEAANIASTFFLMVALAAIHMALESRKGRCTVLAIVAAALVVLTDWLGGVALVCGCFAILVSRRQRARQALARLGLIGTVGYAIAAPRIPPSAIATVHRNAQNLSGSFPMGPWQYLYLAGWFGGALALALLLRKLTSVSEAGCFALVFLLMLAVPPLAYNYFGIYPLPQPQRYFIEMDAAFALAASLALGSRRIAGRRWARVLMTAGLLCMTLFLIPRWRKDVRGWLPGFDIRKTVEYEQATYLNRHYTGQRVFVDGSTRYWFSVFADNPEVGGSVDQARTNPAMAAYLYAVPWVIGEGTNAVNILEAIGVRAIAVAGHHTRDAFHGYRDPDKFRGMVPEVWRDGDDAIYEIPGTGSLAHVVGSEALMTTNPLNYTALRRYAAAVEADTHTRMVWSSPVHATVDADLAPPRALSVQITYDEGWRATANGIRLQLHKDAMGFLVLYPECHGKCTVDLVYDGGPQRRLTDCLCVLGIIACAWIWRSRLPDA